MCVLVGDLLIAAIAPHTCAARCQQQTFLRSDSNPLVCGALQVNGYPSSPFPTNKYVFVNQFQELKEKTSKLLTRNGTAPCREVCDVAALTPIPLCVPAA